MKIPEDRTERLARELELGEALLREERRAAEQGLTEVHRNLGAALTQIAERDRQIAERDRQIVDRDRAIVDRDRVIIEKDRQLIREDFEARALLQALTATRQRLEAIESSIAWRIIRRLRNDLDRWPRLRNAVLTVLRLAYGAVGGKPGVRPGTQQPDGSSRPHPDASPQPQAPPDALSLPPAQPKASSLPGPDTPPAVPSDTLDAAFAEPVFGWFGGDRFEAFESHAPDRIEPGHGEATAALAADQDAARALRALRAVAPCEMIMEIFHSARSGSAAAGSAMPSYCIVTVVDAETRFFRACAASVGRLVDSLSLADRSRVEWLIVSDDPPTSPDALTASLPDGLRASVRILHDDERRGTVARLNEACRAAGSQWLLFLNGDDEIEPHATAALDRTIARFANCRYVSSCGVDIDETGTVLRRRPCVDPTRLFEDDDAIGPLIAIRRDLFLSLGSYRAEHSPCHDHDFALRAALHEPLVRIPDHLCRARCRKDVEMPQGGALRQARTAIVLQDFLRTLAERRFSSVARPAERGQTRLKSGLCLIRTQGTRLDFLEEAVLSVTEQSVPVTPCVVVHGNEEATETVRRHLSGRGIETIVIAAPDVEKRRGYPLNTGLDYLRQRAKDYDFFFFLDDDDVLYPFFAARLVELLDLTGADVGVADANSRVPWEPATRNHNLKPAAALLAGNFMPIHSFIMRTALLADRALRFDEKVDYLEDWDFLISVVAANASFRFLPEALCEFRIIGDGSTPEKNRPIHYEFCRRQILARASGIARRAGPGRFLRDLADFDFNDRPELTPYETDHLRSTWELFVASATEAVK